MKLAHQCLVLAAAALLVGCSTPTPIDAIQKGNARLLPESFTFGGGRIAGIVDVGGQRYSVSTFQYQCQLGVGTLFTQDGGPIDNVLTSGDKPQDRLFRDLCMAGRNASSAGS